MTQLHKVGAGLSAIGRCTLVGMLVGMLATQAVAEGAAVTNPQSPAKPETTSVPNGWQTEQINLATTVNLPLAPQDSANQDSSGAAINALPDAPMESMGMSESSSLTMPPELKAMMDDAKQNSQNLQPAPAKPHGVQRPGMLVMGIAGIPLLGIGGLFYAVAAGSHKNAGAAVVAGSVFFVPGALMSGFGFYYAFKPKQ